MKSLLAKTDHVLLYYYVFIVFIVLVGLYLPNQNNLTAVWLRLVRKHNAKCNFFNVYIFYNSFEVLYMGHTLTNITKHSCHYCDHLVASIYQIIGLL